MSSLRLRPLTPDKVVQAFVLVQLVTSDVSRVAWSDFAEERISQTWSPLGGILTVQDPHGIMVGLASYTVENGFDDVLVVTVDHLLVIPIIDQQRDAVLSALLGAMTSASHRCSTVQFQLGTSGSAILDQHAHRLLEATGTGEKYVLPLANKSSGQSLQ